MPECAIEGCIRIAHPRFCWGDGAHHYHGRVHLAPTTVLVYRAGWGQLCDQHAETARREWAALRASVGSTVPEQWEAESRA